MKVKRSKGADKGMPRQDLLKILGLVSPALAAIDLIPVMTHFWSTGTTIMAYNDEIAISHPLEPLSSTSDLIVGAFPGSILSILKSSKAKNVTIDATDSNITVKAASSRLKLTLLAVDEYQGLFTMPEPKSAKGLPINSAEAFAEVTEAIRLCLQSVGLDASQPEHLGVTVIPGDGKLDFFSTDDVTITHAEVIVKGSTAKHSRFILSAEFCRAFLSIFKDHKLKSFEVLDDHVLAVSDKDVRLFGKLIYTQHITDFVSVLAQHLPKNFGKKSIPIPTKFEGILERALIISGANGKGIKVSLSKSNETTKLVFVAESDVGQIRDVLTVTNHPSCNVSFTPKLLKVGSQSYSRMLFTDQAAVFSRDGGCFLVSTLGG